jgi:hypothetical protein
MIGKGKKASANFDVLKLSLYNQSQGYGKKKEVRMVI